MRLLYFIEKLYNQKRLHSVLRYRSPNEFEESLIRKQNMESARPNPFCPNIGLQSIGSILVGLTENAR